MTGQVKGWCPGAWRPMASGDGLVVRVRAHASRLEAEAARTIADLARTCGNGQIDLGSRGHLQIRGVRADTLGTVQAGLASLGLLDPDNRTEARRNILTTPLWRAGDETLTLVAQLEAALLHAPPLPAKFGFAVDTGPYAVLGGASADIRIERAESGLILRADGMARGMAVSAQDTVPRAIELARWFVTAGDHKRMAQAVAAGLDVPLHTCTPPLPGPVPGPGTTPFGACRALPFGVMDADTLDALAIGPLRLTPWRAVIIEGVADIAPHPGLIADPSDPRLRVAACTGQPGCASASVETRAMAARLAPLVPPGRFVHVSGCAKGCAHPHPADLTLTGRDGAFDLIAQGRAADPPARTALSPQSLFEHLPGLIGAPLAPRL